MVAQYGLLKASELIKNKDLILVGRSINSKRDSTKYREMAMLVEDFIAAMGVSQCSVNLQKSFTLSEKFIFNHPTGTGATVYDNIDKDVAITRGLSQWLYNPLVESSANAGSPANTEWSFDTSDLSQVKNLTYDTLYNEVINNLGSFGSLPGNSLVMHDTVNDKYYLISFIDWQAGGGGGFIYERQEITDICDGCIHFPDGTRLCTSPAAPTFSLPASDYYVDAAFGNDGTGLPNRLDRPYQTIQAALAAAPAGTPALIYVRRGQYSPPTLTFKNLVDFYFEPGATIISGGFQDGGGSVTCKVTGSLVVNGFIGVLNITGGSTINFEFDHITTSFYAFSIAPTVTTANVTIKGNKINATPFAGFNFMSTFRGLCNVKLFVRDYIISNRRIFFVRNSGAAVFQGNLYIECPEITMNGNSTSNYERDVLNCGNTTPITSNITVRGNMIITGVPAAGVEHYTVAVRGGNVKIYGNITGNDHAGIQTDGVVGDVGRVYVKGSVSSNREAIRQSSSTCPVMVEQGLISSNGTTGPYPYVIVQGVGYVGLPDQPNNVLYLKDCRLYNARVDSTIALIDLFQLGNNIYMYNCEADSAGALGELVAGSVPVTSGFQNVRTRKPNSAFVTDVFTPTGVIVDPGLIIPTVF